MFRMMQERELSDFRRFEVPALALVVALGAYLRCRGILHEPYGIDELQSISYLSEPTYGQFLAKMMQFGSPPMPAYFRLEYFLYQHVWRDVFGIRLLSVGAGILTLPFAYLLARRLAGVSTALLATLCLALSPFCVYYSQEARMYALLPLYAVISVHAFLLALEEERSNLWWVVCGIANLLLIWTHMFAALIGVAEGLFLLCFEFRRRGVWLAWGGFLALLFVWLLVWLHGYDTEHMSTFVQQGSSYSIPIILVPIMALLFMAGGLAARVLPHMEAYLPALPDFALHIVIYGLSAWFVVRTLRQRKGDAIRFRHVSLLVLWLIVPVVILTLMAAVKPCFWSRYIIGSAPALAVLAAMAAMAPVSKMRRWLACAALIGVYGLEAVLFLEVPHRADIPGVGKYLQAHRHNEDALITYQLWEPARVLFFPDLSAEGVMEVDGGDLAEKAAPIIARNARTWLLEFCWIEAPREVEEFVRAQNPKPIVTEFPAYFSNIRLYLFERPGAGSSTSTAGSSS